MIISSTGLQDVSRSRDDSGTRSRPPAPRRLESGSIDIALGKYVFKKAVTEDELEQLHQLNYRIFVQEVGQYPDDGSGRLVDKFHHKNTYYVAKLGKRVIGMIAVHDEPPFSIASRLDDPKRLEELGDRLLEGRLYAIEPEHRNSMVSKGLLYMMYEHGAVHGHSHLLISAIEARLRLYKKMGFRPLGPAVGQGDAAFVPMAVGIDVMPQHILTNVGRVRRQLSREEHDTDTPDAPVSLLPGPVQLSDEVRRAVAQPPVSHRGEQFIERFEQVRRILREMSGGLDVAIMVGSGTLANEVVAATIAADTSLRRGLILINGEFGRRLAAQARRWGLEFDTLEWAWGAPWDFDQITARLDRDTNINWIWGAHLETSVARLNNIERLFDLAGEHEARVCLDCVSSLGAVGFDLSRAHLATGVSGKSIAALAGLAFIFIGIGALEHVDASRVPTYLDLGAARDTVGPRFTVSSPILTALDCALSRLATPRQRSGVYADHAALGEYVRTELRNVGLTPLVDGPEAAPVITTFRPPDGMTSAAFHEKCLSWGFELSGLSGYLLERGLVQIATMGAVTRRDCERLFAHLGELLDDD